MTFFIGWRIVLHFSLDQDYTSGNLRAGAVCPPRAPPECFSWFCFGSANCPRNPHFCHSSPIGPRRGPAAPDAGRLPTPKKKGALKPQNIVSSEIGNQRS